MSQVTARQTARCGNFWKRRLTPALIVIAAIVMWAEEWLWRRLKRFMLWLSRFPIVHWYESLIVSLPPYAALVVLLAPGTLLLPIKLLAVYWLVTGHWFLSGLLIVAAKVLGTGLAARTFVLCRPKLMAIVWFRRLHDWILSARQWLYASIRAMPFYPIVRQQLHDAKEAIRAYLQQLRIKGRGIWSRWRAIRRRQGMHNSP